MSHRKPRGINGPVRLTSGVAETEFRPCELPDDKAGIERFICDGALRAMRFHAWKTWPIDVDPHQSREDDFDFVFDAQPSAEYLDLVEVAPLKGIRGGYEGAPSSVPRKKLVNAVMSAVQNKSMRYGLNRRVVVHLLLYVTDFRFLISDGCTVLLKKAMLRNSYRFKSISYFAPIDNASGHLRVLYPAPDGTPYLSPEDEERLREGTVTNFDPRKWQFDSERGAHFQGSPNSQCNDSVGHPPLTDDENQHR